MIGKINKQLVQAQEIYGFFVKNFTMLYMRPFCKDIPDGSSKEGTDSGLEFITSPNGENEEPGVLKVNGACEPKIPYLKPFNLDRYEKSDPEESESKSSHAGLDGVLTKNLQYQLEKGLRYKFEQQLAESQFRMHMIELYETKMAEGLTKQVVEDMHKREKEKIHATILKKIEWQKNKQLEQEQLKKDLKNDIKALLNKDKKPKEKKMNVSPNNQSDESNKNRVKNSPAPVMTSSEEYEDNFNYTLNMIHPLVFTPAESRPHMTSANQDS